MFSKQLLHSSTIRLALIALVLCGITLVGARSTSQVKAEELRSASIESAFELLALPAGTQAEGFDCQVERVNIVMNTGHGGVHCSPANGAIYAFNFPSIHTPEGRAALAVMLTAQTTGKKLHVIYDAAFVGNPNCPAEVCREAIIFGVAD